MSVRRYIGMEITKARQEKFNLVQKSLPKKRGRKQKRVLDLSRPEQCFKAFENESNPREDDFKSNSSQGRNTTCDERSLLPQQATVVLPTVLEQPSKQEAL